ncbi:hypothetical protein [Chondromyces crocatus]|uniref:Glycosyltransferase RgtA/B/C/D-like domain-containing protein n=1 Tax=Chondromyces crocatus TaxID=52 RepID=A0A0K1EA31_CHOCO|nr:hypothetical protein [Chondromyces crocatus]AKT37704.1 uncharacterized protein CMC5_018460 [Chondromyces crocatus]
MRPSPSRLTRLAERAGAYLPALLVSTIIGAFCVRAILAKAGHPAVPLDDAFIHFQFARRLAGGHFFSYVDGEGYSSGATSQLWPLLLAPFYKLGLRDLSIIWAAWLLGTLAHAGVAVEATRLTRPLAGRAAAIGAGALCLAFGAFAWFAWSGMETMALAWILLRAGRVAAAWIEPDRDAPPRTLRGALGLGLLGAVAPLIRPEGVLATLIATAALAMRPASPPSVRFRHLPALTPLAGVALGPALNWSLTGDVRATTTTAKWLLGNPSYEGATLVAAVWGNVKLLFTDVLDGGGWTTVFLPDGARVPFLLGLLALPIAAVRRRRPAHAAVVALLALGVLIPCTYLTFLWNRLRYVWPFVPAWFVMVACLAGTLGDGARWLRRVVARRLQRRLYPTAWLTPLLLGGATGVLATRLPWTVQDLSQSASAIDRQQVWLGRWAEQHLPADAILGVNDTGAIAYLSGRRTFDIVGLTTSGEARYWIAGAGSRFEHYERLPRARLPTHFVVYPHWMSCPPLLGRELVSATVTEQSILGGVTMTVYEARYDALGSGAFPERLGAGERILDEVDVADLESEASHQYDKAHGHDQNNRLATRRAPSSHPTEALPRGTEVPTLVADGGRYHRRRDRFMLGMPTPRPNGLRLVLRVMSDTGATLRVRLGGQELGEVEVPGADGERQPWVERSLQIPTATSGSAEESGVIERDGAPVEVELLRGGSFHAFHYWLVGGE